MSTEVLARFTQALSTNLRNAPTRGREAVGRYFRRMVGRSCKREDVLNCSLYIHANLQ